MIARRAPVVDDAPRPPAEPPSDDTQDDPRLLVAAVVTAAAAAAGASWLGVQWRAFSSRRLGPSWVGAVLEDAAVIALAAGAAR